jgi:hypothetical protein
LPDVENEYCIHENNYMYELVSLEYAAVAVDRRALVLPPYCVWVTDLVGHFVSVSFRIHAYQAFAKRTGCIMVFSDGSHISLM